MFANRLFILKLEQMMSTGSIQYLCFPFKGFATKEYMLGNLAVQGTWTMTAFFGAKVFSFVNMIFPRYDDRSSQATHVP